MWCRQVRKQLSAYADGELAAGQVRGVEEHLSRCAACRREHEALARLVEVTTSLPIEEVPAGLHSRILTRLAYAAPGPAPALVPPAPRPALPWFWPVCAGATAALVLGAVLQSRPGAVAGLTLAPGSMRPAVPRVAEQTARSDAPKAAEPSVIPSQPVTAREVPVPGSPAPAPERLAEAPAVEPPVTAAGPTAPAAKPLKRTRITGTGRRAPRAFGSVLPGPAGQPLAVLPMPERPESAPRLSEPSNPLMTQTPLSMPGDPVINSTAVPQTEEPAVPETGPRVAGMSMVGMTMETTIPAPEDEGLRQLQMFIEERNRTVPQPPVTTPKNERKGKKS